MDKNSLKELIFSNNLKIEFHNMDFEIIDEIQKNEPLLNIEVF